MVNQVPKHIAIIMDGNGRWATKRMLPRSLGHREGAKALRKILEASLQRGIKVLTVYAFSTENWKRSSEEVNYLMDLFYKYLKNERDNLMKNEIRFYVSGSKNGVSEKLLNAIEELQEETKNNKKLIFNIAFNYGGRQEIVDAVNKILQEDEKKEITEEDIFKNLYNDFIPPDLIIRTGGEYRLSNFLLWQLAYSEIYFTEVLWPDFSEKELDLAIEDYNRRERRFGGNSNA